MTKITLNKFKNLLLLSVIPVTISFSVIAQVFYPEYQNVPVIDLANKFDGRYITKLQNDLEQYDNDIRVVFLDSKAKINLGIYAAKLFDKWDMPDNGILVVIDPYLNKKGYAIGKAIQEELKKRKKVESEKPEKPENTPDIDYNNLAGAIYDKFAPENAIVSKDSQSKTNSSENSSASSVTKLGSSSDNVDSVRDSKSFNYSSIFRYFMATLVLALFSSIAFYFYRKKQRQNRKSEQKDNYSFELSMKLQELYDGNEKLEKSIQNLSRFTGETAQANSDLLDKLEKTQKKLDSFTEQLNELYENISEENLEEVEDCLEKYELLSNELNNIQNEALTQRKDLKSIMDKSNMKVSDLRVNLENLKNLFEELRTLYKLELNFLWDKIIKQEQELSIGQDYISRKDPLAFSNKTQEIQNNIKAIKKSFDVIPHLYNQLQENIPVTIKNLLLSIDNKEDQKNYQLSLDKLKISALEKLSYGDLDQSEVIINQIFEKINELKNLARS